MDRIIIEGLEPDGYPKDLTGLKFGFLRVLRPARKNSYECVCENCKRIVIKFRSALTTRYTKSCGKCLKHPYYNHPLYWKHHRMIQDVITNGTPVGVINFVEWGEASGYEKKLSIDRIDNNGPYAPWNCRWATNLEQQNNIRTNTKIQFGDEIISSSEFGRRLGLAFNWAEHRLYNGWNSDEIVYVASRLPTKIVRKNGNFYNPEGFIELIPVGFAVAWGREFTRVQKEQEGK